MLLRLLETIHGHLGILAVAALLHPAVLMRKGLPPSFRTRLAIAAAVLLTVLAFGLGLYLYGDYRALVKRDLFRVDPQAGYLFETKEHLAYTTLAFALGGSVLGWLGRDTRTRKLAAVFFGCAAMMCVLVAALGTYVAARRGFPH